MPKDLLLFFCYTAPMRATAAILVLLFLVLPISIHADKEQTSIEISPVGPQPADRQWVLHEDTAIRMVAVNYGDAENKSTPGLFIFRKATSDWVRVNRISTAGAKFGRSPTMEECKKAGKPPPSIGWDFRGLARQKFVEIPLTAAGFLFFPDKVELIGKVYILRFNSNWKIFLVETSLRFKAEDLSKQPRHIPSND